MTESGLQIRCFVEPMFGENAYVVLAGGGADRVCWVVDPSFEVDALLAFVRDERARVDAIILTHGHGDHIAGVDAVRAAHPAARLRIAREDQPMLTDAARNLSAPFGISLVVNTPADGDLAPRETVRLGEFDFEVLDTSGHSPGGRSLYCRRAGVVLTGDALFAGSIGRTDFPGSEHHRLLRNIREHLLTLPDETIVYSGHGEPTTIGNERKSNPFLVD